MSRFSGAFQQRARAERHFASVRALANTFMFQMDESIRDLPGATAARELLVQTALKYLDTLSKESGADRNLQLELAGAYEKVGDIQGQVYSPNTGKFQAAMASYAEAIALLTSLAAANPADTEVRVALATEHLKRSRVLALLTGDIRAAVAESQQSVAIFQELAAAKPHEAAAQDRLAAAYSAHAFHLGWSGQSEAAISSVYQGVALTEELRHRDPSNLTFEFHLSRQYGNAGVIVQARGFQPATIEESLSFERRALDLDRHLLAVDPEHALRYQRAIAADLANIGIELYERGDYAGALEEYDAALDAGAKTATDQNNSQARLDVARITIHLPRALFASGGGDAAATAFMRSMDALNTVAARGETIETNYLLGTCEMGLGLIETQRAMTTMVPDGAAQARHWRAAQDWFAVSVPHYERLLKEARFTLTPQETRGYDQALAGLARSKAEMARLEGRPAGAASSVH